MSVSLLLRAACSSVLLAAGLTAGTATAAAAAGPEVARAGCGDVPPYFYDIRTRHVTCAAAKRLAPAWLDKASSGEAYIKRNVRVKGFRCHYTSTSHVRCRDGGRRVRFLASLM